jgi:DNA-binding MarR family transcriptional regulator
MSPTPPASVGTGSPDIVFGEQDLRMSARLLLHIGRQPRFEPMEQVPRSLTQEGMADALRAPQGTVSSSLTRLVDGGVLRVELGHVRGKLRRLKVYQLTDRGEAIVRHIRAGMDLHGRGSATPPRPPMPRGAGEQPRRGSALHIDGESLP